MTLVLLAVSANAQQDDLAQTLIDTKIDVDLGVFYPDKERVFRVSGGVGIENFDTDVEEELKLNKSEEVFSTEIGWRFSERWRLAGQYFSVKDGNTLTLTQDVEWEDIVYQAGSSVGAATSFSVIRLFFSRDFLSAPHHTLGIGVGLHQMEIKFSMEGQAIVPGGGTEFRSESVRTQAPMPNIRAWDNRRLSPRWVFATRLDWLEASVSPYDGSIVNAAAGFHYTISEHLAVGLNYNYFHLNVGIQDTDWRGDAEIRFHGPYVAIKAFW